ncbi:MAG TPA: ATP-binding cassette domain-containing protein [Pyrinomonadaceae bacterium]|jgi:molybdate transport system ATP-binding protein
MISVRIRKDFGGKTAISERDEDASSHDARTKFKLDVEFEAPAGISILFGASGSGKTTTIKSIAGIVQPDSGRISINGHTLFDSEQRINKPIRERGVGLVFQNLALFPHMSAIANVEFAVSARSRQERRERALELMRRLHISHTAERRPSDISGGEAQRVALARALASSPRLLLLDEPLSAIDETTRRNIITDLKMINRELRVPVIYVTHNRDEAIMLGDYLIAYERGRIVAAGEPVEIFGGPVAASVARLTGVENIFEGVVQHRNIPAGTMTVLVADNSGSCELEIPLGKETEGQNVRVAIRAGDILLATDELRSTSARNMLSGRITMIEERGAQCLVRIESGVSWAASVTRQAVAELGLARDRKIWMAIKTHSCYLLDG